MLLEEIKKIKSSTKELREFGLVVGGILLLIAVIHGWKHGNWNFPLLGAGAALILAGAALPAILTPFQKAWMTLGLVMGAVMSRVILCVIFFVVVTPLGLILRARGKRFMTRIDRSVPSYWNLRSPDVDPRKRCETQF